MQSGCYKSTLPSETGFKMTRSSPSCFFTQICSPVAAFERYVEDLIHTKRSYARFATYSSFAQEAVHYRLSHRSMSAFQNVTTSPPIGKYNEETDCSQLYTETSLRSFKTRLKWTTWRWYRDGYAVGCYLKMSIALKRRQIRLFGWLKVKSQKVFRLCSRREP